MDKKLEEKLRHIHARLDDSGSDELWYNGTEIKALFKSLLSELCKEVIGEGKPVVLRKDKIKEDIAWCDGREKLRQEQLTRLERIME